MNASRSIVEKIESKMRELRSKTRRVGEESVSWLHAVGRISSQPLLSFRDSPSIHVSAMDGYAMHLQTAELADIPIVGIAAAGTAPLHCEPGMAVKIFTGGAVPQGAEIVIRREDCLETPSSKFTESISLQVSPQTLRSGQNIRFRGENASKGDAVLSSGKVLGAHALAGVASFAASEQLQVFQKIRVGIINTGDELVDLGSPIADWQVRDSNGPLLQTFLNTHPWIETKIARTADSLQQIHSQLESFLEECDAVILTGGVSMGDSDHVPEAILRTGSSIEFHKIPIRPGKPLLGAVSTDRKLIMGLPGNPVSVAVTFRRFAFPLLQWMAGIDQPDRGISVPIQWGDSKTLPLVWYRLVSRDSSGGLQLSSTLGSGDVSSLANSDGFVEVPPHETSSGIRRFFSWH